MAFTVGRIWRALRRWLGYEEEPIVELVGGLSDPLADMCAQRLRGQGIIAMVKTSTPLLGDMAGTATDYALCVRASDAARIVSSGTRHVAAAEGPRRPLAPAPPRAQGMGEVRRNPR